MKQKVLKWVLTSFIAASLALTGSHAAVGQTLVVKGRVVEHNGDPVIGATIMIKGTLNGTTADENGLFSLSAAEGQMLEVSCISYKTVEVQAGKEFLTITLETDTEELEKVVVVAYGEIRAKDFTGSVEAIRVEDSPAALNGFTSAGEFLRGNVPGLQVGEVSGTGQSPSLLVRGKKNLSGGGSPMLVVDGMIYSGDLNSIDPNNIESLSVLKDASSLAAYGSRAADGVIIITTKRGKMGKPVISFSSTQQIAQPTYIHKYFDGAGYIRLRNARIGNYANLDDPSFMSDLEFKNYMVGKETDWYKLATQTGWTQNYNVGVSGANERLNYAVNFGWSGQNGVMVGDAYQRINLSSRLSAKITENLEVGLTMDFNKGIRNGSAASGEANATPYGSPWFDNTGAMRYYVEGSDNVSTNPLWSTTPAHERNATTLNNRYNAYLEWKLPWIKGLSYRMAGSYSRNSSYGLSFTHEDAYPAMASGANEDGYSVTQIASANGSANFSTGINWVLDNILSYNRQFGKHYVSGTLVYTRDWTQNTGFSESGSNFTDLGNTLLGVYSLEQAGTISITSPGYLLKTDIGYLGRIVYSFDGRYHINASVRRDGSSVFGDDRKWGIFPAFGVAWNISNEKFMRGARFIDDLKLKASWGVNGSQALGSYGTLSRITMGKGSTAYTYLDGSGNYVFSYPQYVSTLGNSDLGWQQTQSFNAGIEAALLGRRLNFEVNVYKSMTTDQITSRTIPIMGSGINSQTATMGRIDNWGVEATLNSVNVRRGEFNWTSQLTFNLNRNKLVYLWGGEDEESDYTNERFIGESLDVIWFYENDGIIQEDGTGSMTSWPAGYPNVIDQDGNGSLDRYDKVFLGNRMENFRMTLTNTFNYKNWQLYFMLNGTFGGNGYCLADNTFAYYTHYNLAYVNALDIPFWTPDNHNDTYPSAQYVGNTNLWRKYNSYANIRLQNLNISYNLTPLAKKLKAQSARIYLSGQNLFYFAPFWKLSDPGARSRTGTLMRTFTFGINVSF